MATLTYDDTEQQEGELSTEEKESLEVGEKLAEQENALLAGKFKDAEDLEKGYLELQQKLGEPKEEKAEVKEEVEEEKPDEIDASFLDTLWEESQNEYSKETLDKLSNMDTREIAQMYLQQRASDSRDPDSSLTEENIGQLKGVGWGEEEYGSMMGWAKDNLTENEIAMYDHVMDQGNPLAAYFAVQALAYRYNDARGVDGELLTGKAAKSEGSQFRSQAEVVRAMSDPKYDSDPAYRQDIYNKLERSNLDF